MNLFFSFLSGFIFGLGLSVSGLTNPNLVRAFLDITGNWNPHLIFVMGGALIVSAVGYRWSKRQKPLYCSEYSLPQNEQIDWKLVLGPILFGVGWGLLGVCPGPGIVNLITFTFDALLFIGSMITGMLVFKLFSKHLHI